MPRITGRGGEAAHPPHAGEAGLNVFLKRQLARHCRRDPAFLELVVSGEADLPDPLICS